MYQRWRKIGLIFSPGQSDWMKTHAQNPLPEHLGNGIFRVYFAARDALNRARGGYFVFNINDPFTIITVSKQPIIDLGPLGAFDDCGVMPSTIVDYEEKRYLYYTGWSKAVEVPFSFHIGLAISDDGGKTYERASLAPVLGRNHYDPYITGAPYVLFESSIFKMWYISGTKWEKESENAKPKHYYTVKYAESNDGINWKTSDHLCLDYESEEYAIARPVVRKINNDYEMWFTFRGGQNTYRVGIATSIDGKKWERIPTPIGIDVSKSGWDSEMICYAHPLEFNGRLFALYNGNGYGSTGVGLAVFDST